MKPVVPRHLLGPDLVIRDHGNRYFRTSGLRPGRTGGRALLIDCEEDRTLRAVLIRMLQEAER